MSKQTLGYNQNTWYCKMMLTAILLSLPLMSFFGSAALSAKTVTGVVTSATDNEPLIGVTVKVEGSSSGTITDFDGKYSINANPGQTIVFSYIGFVSKSVKVGSDNVINISLKEDSRSLEEVVVVGYGTMKKKLVTGATTQLKGESVAKLNTTNPLQAMQGQTAGVNIQSTSGQPGSSMKVQIRGLGTVGNSSPLYLIDGIGGDISTLNPADIESIDILKDAASAAIYGAQAANGVVLITTKSGKEGKAEVSFDAYMGWQSAARKADMLNSHEYMTIMDEARINSGGQPYNWDGFKSIYNYAEDGSRLGLIDTDWVDTMFKDNAKVESYTLGVTGGGSISTYAMSLGYMSQEGIVGGKDVRDRKSVV